MKRGGKTPGLNDMPYMHLTLRDVMHIISVEPNHHCSLLSMEKLWETVAPTSYKELYITTSPLKPKELLIPRYILGKILAA